MLLPAPVELPCRDNRTKGLCNRTRRSPTSRSGSARSPATADLLHLLCGPVEPGPVQSCTRPVRTAATIRAVAGHMHLLGRGDHRRRQQGHPEGQAGARHPELELRRPGQHPAEEAGGRRPGRHGHGHLHATTRGCATSCRRSAAPTDRYVAWGEGTTDEMCLGIVLMTAR